MVPILGLKKIEQELMSDKINQIEPNISNEDIEAVTEYMGSGNWITEHEVTNKLENEISEYVGRKYGIAVPNGTIAIYLALVANGIGEGSKVAVPNITMIASINAVLWAGAEPVIIDTNEDYCMSLKSLDSAKNIDSVIYVPLNGRTTEGSEIESYCKNNNQLLIEDSAHALGSSYLDKKCGSLGDISTLSFTPHKIITMGQGGMLLFDNENLYDKILDLKTFNRSKDRSDTHKGFGLNFKITDLQASLGLSQLKSLEKFINIKKNIYNQYKKLLKVEGLNNFLEHETPWFIDFVCNSNEEQIKLASYLDSFGIVTRYSYPSLSSQGFLKDTARVDLSYSESFADKIIWLPSSTNLKSENIDFIATKINEFYNK